jgi:2-polyprenyl-3-methyl-5-hydroxy-6-metoxy-1,4-benzoquinol methylase
MGRINCIVCGSRDAGVLWEKDGFSYNICPDCGLVYLNPQPSSGELENFYNNSYRVNIRRYLGRKKKWFEIIKMLGKYSNGKDMLEIGCSYGLFLKIAKDRGFNVKGIEISHDAADYARKNYGIDVESGDLNQAMGRIENNFDFICMWHTIEHLKKPDDTLFRVRRLLKDDGILVLTTPNFKSLPARKMGMFWEWVNPPKHLFLFSMETISGLLKKQGYEVVKIFTRGGDYKAFLLSLLTYPVRKRKYLNKIKRSSADKFIDTKNTGKVEFPKTRSNLSDFGDYWNLRLKEIFGMDFIFYYPYSFKNLGPEIFVIAKKSR